MYFIENPLLNRSLNKRNAMLDAGIAELAEQGLAGASMESIAARAEVSKRTLYKHFPSREAVFDAVLALLIERVDPLGGLHYDVDRDFAKQLREIAEKEMQLICDPDFVRLSRILMVECMRSQARSYALMQQFGEKENGLFRWFSEAGKARQARRHGPARRRRPVCRHAESLHVLAFGGGVATGARQGGAEARHRRSLPDAALPSEGD